MLTYSIFQIEVGIRPYGLFYDHFRKSGQFSQQPLHEMIESLSHCIIGLPWGSITEMTYAVLLRNISHFLLSNIGHSYSLVSLHSYHLYSVCMGIFTSLASMILLYLKIIKKNFCVT